MSIEPSKSFEVSDSLDADERLLPFLPALLQDLWALGFSPDPMLKLLIRSGLAKHPNLRVLDLGCGKGAALVRLAREFGWHGEGVDLMPDFIQEARKRSAEYGVADRLRFEVAAITQAVRQGPEIDLILFGFDADVLGTLEESLKVLRSRLASAGHIVLDTAWTRGESSKPNVAMSETSTKSAVRAAGFDVIDEEILDSEWVRAQNHDNTEAIRRRARELGRRYPEKQPWFDDYVRRQEEECRQLEEEFACCILLLRARV